MSIASRCFLSLALIAMLSSCDRVKQGLLTVVKEGASKASATIGGGVPVHELGAADYQQFIETTEDVAVVVYHSEACPACEMLDPVLKRVIAGAGGPVKLGRVDVNLHQELAKESAVLGLPDVRMYINGAQVDRFVGAEKESMVKRKLDAQVKRLKSGDLPPRPPKEADSDAASEPPLKQPTNKEWLPPGMERP